LSRAAEEVLLLRASVGREEAEEAHAVKLHRSTVSTVRFHAALFHFAFLSNIWKLVAQHSGDIMR